MKTQIYAFLIAMLCLFSVPVIAQSVHLPAGHAGYHWVDRWEIKSGELAPFHTSHRYFSRRAVTEYALQLDTMLQVELTEGDLSDMDYWYADNGMYLAPRTADALQSERYARNERSLLGYFYRTPAEFLKVDGEEFSLSVLPIADSHVGQERNGGNTSGYYGQANGGTLQGSINDRVHFYSTFALYFDRHQAQVRDFVNTYRTMPGNGFFKRNNTFMGTDSLYDYINAQGYIDFKLTDNIHAQFGHGRNFIGNGRRSLLLSDFADNYLYLKFNTSFGIFDYQNIFAQMRKVATNNPNVGLNNQKYLASHHLSVNLGDHFNIGLYEAVVLARETGFELEYLNPIIFYRSVERSLGSPDNAFIGLDFKWNFLRRFQVYGQMGMDELQASRLLPDPQSWAHKFAFQLGGKYIDVLGIDHLDLQIEHNAVRPHTYQHWKTETAYSHGSQPLAHPLGANFRETLVLLRYQPSTKLYAQLQLMHATVGRDTLGSNWGSNWLIDYQSRESDVVTIGQGVNTQIALLDLQLTYMLYHNLFLDLQTQIRRENSALDALDNRSVFFSAGFRYNFWRPDTLY